MATSNLQEFLIVPFTAQVVTKVSAITINTQKNEMFIRAHLIAQRILVVFCTSKGNLSNEAYSKDIMTKVINTEGTQELKINQYP